MLSRIAILWAVFATIMGFALGGAFVSSYRAPPQHQSSTGTEHGTANQNSKEETDAALAHYTWWLTLFTGVMAFATVGLGVATVGLYLTGEKQIGVAKQAADAAMLSAKAAIGLELPFLRIEPGWFGFGTSKIGDTDIQRYYCVVGKLTAFNDGRTRAFPAVLRCGWFFGKDLPKEPIYKYDATFGVDVIIEPSPKEPMEFYLRELEIDLPIDAYERLRSGADKFWFYCRLGYLDFMRTRHEDCFCWRRIESFGAGTFTAEDAQAYNHKT